MHKELIEELHHSILIKLGGFQNGFIDFLISLASWILHILSGTNVNNSEDFWVSLNTGSGGWIVSRSLRIYTIGYNINTRERVNTFE